MCNKSFSCFWAIILKFVPWNVLWNFTFNVACSKQKLPGNISILYWVVSLLVQVIVLENNICVCAFFVIFWCGWHPAILVSSKWVKCAIMLIKVKCRCKSDRCLSTVQNNMIVKSHILIWYFKIYLFSI